MKGEGVLCLVCGRKCKSKAGLSRHLSIHKRPEDSVFPEKSPSEEPSEEPPVESSNEQSEEQSVEPPEEPSEETSEEPSDRTPLEMDEVHNGWSERVYREMYLGDNIASNDCDSDPLIKYGSLRKLNFRQKTAFVWCL